ncbi:MAG TPA: 4-hydroxy-tetrahydrodipicolinate reductase [Vicinamibacterales bacterium]|nr:4-hydroxy-tetrahydrodipicolinate reductase [Vicinamibacterales bacterium]
MRLLIVGYGRMGKLVATLCPEYGSEVAGTVDIAEAAAPDTWPQADVAIDFSIADAVPGNARRLAERHVNIVIGTTGWGARESEVRKVAEQAGIGVVAAPNFALGVNLFVALAERAAELFGPRAAFGAWIHEAHHAAKRDAPSGTALLLEGAMKERAFNRPIDVSSTRAGSIPGTHTIGFDAAGETITLTHTARDRSGFARGALEAARWVHGRKGWFTMKDVLGI